MEEKEAETSELEELLTKKKKRRKKTKMTSSSSCTHTHTCNPPGPDHASHSHTCFHSHTLLFPDKGENCQSKGNNNNNSGSSSSLLVKKGSSGNREAVRKYREKKKKAHTAYLEDEVKRLRSLNHHLLRKLENQASVEAEVIRLRGLLVDLRGKIEGELGALSFHKHCGDVGEGAVFVREMWNVRRGEWIAGLREAVMVVGRGKRANRVESFGVFCLSSCLIVEFSR